jgi:ATP-dependent Lon protease
MSFFGKSNNRGNDATVEELRRKVSSAGLPVHVRDVAEREIELLSKIDQATAEYSIGLTYIEYLLNFPWSRKTEDNLDLEFAESVLNSRHYGLENIKSRIIEHLAVKVLRTKKKPRVLVVDDEEVALKNMVRILKREGYTTEGAGNGIEAMRRLEESFYDVVLTDLKMDHFDGMELLERVKNRTPETQVILITGYASIESAIETIKKGAFQYIQKPIRADVVRSVVRDAIGSKHTSLATKGSVLCFAGPPGTGKTSLGKAIADALGRKFSRISLGGLKDEAEIRGHRRTYAGAMPGRIVEEIKRTGVINPLIMLDELDKLGQDFKGDSSSALLEALDPEQNHSFLDHYLDVPVDLSNVMFIGTANVSDNIAAPLLDRMEVINFSGYTKYEKKEIAVRHLIPKHINEKGLADNPPVFSDDAVYKIIQEYTREAGIRNLEREIASICRKIASEVVHHPEGTVSIQVTPEMVGKYLGPRRYYVEVASERDMIGVTTGLVWTETGGAIIFVEAVKMKGTGELILTGSLGEIMRESAQAALSYIRSNASAFGIETDMFSTTDIHIHVPAGAIPKDGPSAGATIAMALLSLLTGKKARRDVAVSGEITLTGRMLPVGGTREKILAARQAGVSMVIFPSKNRVDIECLPAIIRDGIDIQYADSVNEIVDYILITE